MLAGWGGCVGHVGDVEYRQAMEGPWGVAAAVGYAALAGTLVVGTSLLARRAGAWWALPAGLAAAASIALPALVPAALPRAEYGKDAVWHASDGGPYEDPATGWTNVCFVHGVEGAEPAAGPAGPSLCLQLENAPPEAVSAYDLAEQLNDSGTRPYDQLEDRSGLVPPARDRAARTSVIRLATHMRTCRRALRDYVPCAEPVRLRRAGVELGPAPGQASVVAVSPDEYTVVGRSLDGGAFTLTQRDGAPATRACVPPGDGRCPASGRW
jgi:hypothetical protein